MKLKLLILLLATSFSAFSKTAKYECKTYSSTDSMAPGELILTADTDAKLAWVEIEGEVELGQVISSQNTSIKVKLDLPDFKGIFSTSIDPQVDVLNQLVESNIARYNVEDEMAKRYRSLMQSKFGDKNINGKIEMLGEVVSLMSCK